MEYTPFGLYITQTGTYFSATSPPGTLRNFKSGKAMSASGDIAIKRDALV